MSFERPKIAGLKGLDRLSKEVDLFDVSTAEKPTLEEAVTQYANSSLKVTFINND